MIFGKKTLNFLLKDYQQRNRKNEFFFSISTILAISYLFRTDSTPIPISHTMRQDFGTWELKIVRFYASSDFDNIFTAMIFPRQLMEFLMGLHDRFDSIQNQILLMESLPNVNNSYSMITTVEKQMEVRVLMNGEANTDAMFIKL